MIVRTTSKEPEKLADRFADGQVVDAGNSPGHETVFIGILSVSCTDPDKKRASVTNGDEPFIVPPILPRRSDNTMSISYAPPGTEMFDRRRPLALCRRRPVTRAQLGRTSCSGWSGYGRD
jgi:hypothetical protein